MWGWSPKKPKSPLERLEDKLKGDRALAFYSSLGAHAADAVSGGVIFVTGTATMQLVQKAIYVGASTLIIPKALGLAAVCASSTAAIHFASTPRELAHEWSNSSMSIADLMEYGRSRFKARWEDLPDAPYPAYMAIGVLCFRILGGRFSSLAPSNFANLGAFHLKKASLPATEEYATSVERGIVQEFGRLFGCHTCGVKRGVRYHADHMPPKL